MLDDERLLDLFEHLALQAGRCIMEVRGRGVRAEIKSDLSPVTEADRAAETIILAGLREQLPGVICVAEEEVAAGAAFNLGNEPFILIDPLDGTREFIGGKPDFTVNIALVRDGVPVVGTVYAPARGDLYSGRSGHASIVEIGSDFSLGARRQIAVRDLPDRPTVVASRSHRTPETDAFISALGDVEVCSIGSSLKFGLLARGEADIYPRLGRTMEWDTAAGDAVLRAAGGITVEFSGRPLTYGRPGTPNAGAFSNPWFLAVHPVFLKSQSMRAACRGVTDAGA